LGYITRRYNVNVLGVYCGEEMLMTPTADIIILKGDDLLLLGHRGDVENIENLD
jgi:Trk K+ transport system NAD-binding subunit